MNKPPVLSHFTAPNYWEFSYEKLMISGGRNAIGNWRGVHVRAEHVFPWRYITIGTLKAV